MIFSTKRRTFCACVIKTYYKYKKFIESKEEISENIFLPKFSINSLDREYSPNLNSREFNNFSRVSYCKFGHNLISVSYD